MSLLKRAQGTAISGLTLVILMGSSIASALDQPKVERRELELRPHMQLAYGALVKVLAATAKESEVNNYKGMVETESALKVMADEAKIIHSITMKGDKEHEFLSQELQKSTELAYNRYKGGFREQAKFHISDVVSTCFGCHTSRNSAFDSQFTSTFTKDVQLDNFEPLAKARFLSLSRQFELSASEYESLFLSKGLSTDELINLDPMVEYLILTVRVKNDVNRALKAFTALGKRNFPETVKRDIASWVLGLKSIQAQTPEKDKLTQSKNMIKMARGSMEYPRDRSGMVQFVLASKYLHEYVNEEGLSKERKAETYYELGGCENVLATQFSADEANIYFAEAIRLAPKTDLARKAFARYEENVLYGYSGSSGVHLPEDEKLRLENLKKQAL